MCRLLSALEFLSICLPPIKSVFLKGFLIFGMQRDEVTKRIKTRTKGMMWLKTKLHVNKMDTKTKMDTTYHNYTSK